MTSHQLPCARVHVRIADFPDRGVELPLALCYLQTQTVVREDCPCSHVAGGGGQIVKSHARADVPVQCLSPKIVPLKNHHSWRLGQQGVSMLNYILCHPEHGVKFLKERQRATSKVVRPKHSKLYQLEVESLPLNMGEPQRSSDLTPWLKDASRRHRA